MSVFEAPWWSRFALLALIAALWMAWRGLREVVRTIPRSVAGVLLGVTAVGTAIRAFVVPWTVFRSEYVGYVQIETDLALLEDMPKAVQTMPGRGAILELLSFVFPLSVNTLSVLNVALAALAIVAAFLAAWLLSKEHAPTALATSAVIAFDPVHARLSGDMDVNVLMGLCQWLALVGVLLHLRTRRTAGLALAGAAAVFCVFVKLDGVMGLMGVLLLWVLGYRAPGPDPEPRRHRWLYVGGAVVWVAVSVLVLRSIVQRDTHYVSTQVALGPERYWHYLAQLRENFFTRNPYVHPTYTPMFVPLLCLIGVIPGLLRRWREFVWIPVLLAAVLYRVFYDHLDWADDLAQKGNLRWLFHVHLPWFLAAGLGAGWLWDSLRGTRLRWVLPVLGALSLLPTADFWTHRWSYQRETDLIVEAIRTLEPPCAVIDASVDREIHYGASYALDSLMRLEGWGHVPLAHPDQMPPGTDLGCAYYFEGLGCYVRTREDTDPTDASLRGYCQTVRDQFTLEPLRTEHMIYEPFCGHPSRQPEVTVGFHRLKPKPAAAQ